MAVYTVKSGSVSLVIRPWRHPSGRDYWRFDYYARDGKPRSVTRATLPKAKEAAFTKAQELAKGSIDLAALQPSQIRAINRMIEVDPNLSKVDEFISWLSRAQPKFPTNSAVSEFLALKEANQGNSTQNLRTLRKHLVPFSKAFEDRPLADLSVSDLEGFLTANAKNGNRTRKNIRASLVTFFRWCRSREYLTEAKTVAEKLETPITTYKVPDTYTPEEMVILITHVRQVYLPWLVLGGFSMFRTDEIRPIAGSKKSPLDWSDFKWDRDIIIVRPETAKTKRRRVVPIHPVVRRLLWSVRKESGPVLDADPPTKKGKGKGAESETVRLGKLIGGWRTNALRHSGISYRAAQVGIGQTAMEAGNSEAEVKHSYNDAKGKDEADRWFSCSGMFWNVLKIPAPWRIPME